MKYEILALSARARADGRRSSLLRFSQQDEEVDVNATGDSGLKSEGHGVRRNGDRAFDCLFF